MRIFILSILLLSITSLGFAQKLDYSITAGPSISFFSERYFSLNYAWHSHTGPSYRYIIRENTYQRKENIGYGANLFANLNYQFHKRFFFSSGLGINFSINEMNTILVSSERYKFVTTQELPLTNGDNITTYTPNDANGNPLYYAIIDENGLLVYLYDHDFDKNPIKESFRTLYFSIPLTLGFDINEKFQVTFGFVNSVLLQSRMNTEYPFSDERIKENNISKINKYILSIQGGVSYNLNEKFSLSIDYQRNLTDMIYLNKIYNLKYGNKLSVFSFNMTYIINE